MGKMLLNGTVVTPLIVKGGGTEINNQDITVTENGTYKAEDGYTGLGTVEVNVPTSGGAEIKNQDINITTNGTYTADAGYTGLGTVNVNVPNPSTGTLGIVKNGTYDVTNYASAEVNVPAGGEPVNKEKFGLTIDDVLGYVDENGTYSAPTGAAVFNGAGIKTVASGAFYYQFGKFSTVGSAVFEDLKTVANQSFYYLFYQSTKKPTAVFNVEEIPSTVTSAFEHAFDYASGAFPRFPLLRKALGSASFYYFMTNITAPDYDLVFPVLEEVGGRALRLMGVEKTRAYTLSSIKKISGAGVFQPSSSTVGKNDIYLLSAVDMSGTPFDSSVRQVHFAKKNQATIEALADYSTKFASSSAAKNITFFFDLITSITVNGVVYTRSEQDSIRPDIYTKTHIAWKAQDGQVVYTDYTDSVEPAVGTLVYSDAGITQIGTVTEVE